MEGGHHAWHTAGAQQLSPPLPSSGLNSQTITGKPWFFPHKPVLPPSAQWMCLQKTKANSSSPATEDSYRFSPIHVSMWKTQKMTLPFKVLSTS